MKEVERNFLTEDELNRIYNKRFSCERLTLVKDIFIFSCYTGLAYIDVKGLKKDHIAIGIDGEKWIFKNRQKTDTKSKIPVLPIAQEIILKYANHPNCLIEDSVLPILTNQKMNAYLKEIGDFCNIQKINNLSHGGTYFCNFGDTYKWSSNRNRKQNAWTQKFAYHPTLC